jgi:hypothetical protein
VTPRGFESFARERMSKFFGTSLAEGKVAGCPKKWDFVSEDELIVGDAKFLTLVDRSRFPPAKMMEIAGHVWLLETVKNARPFLVFGNQIEVPRLWLGVVSRSWWKK